MKTIVSKAANGAITWFSKAMAATGCFVGCNAPEIPEELV